MDAKLPNEKKATYEALYEAMNTPVSDFPEIEDLWAEEDRLMNLFRYSTRWDKRFARLFRWIGKTYKVLPATEPVVEVLAGKLECGPEKISAKNPPMDSEQRLSYDLSVVRRGYMLDFVRMYELRRRNGDSPWLEQIIQNRRYPVALWRAATVLGVQSEAAILQSAGAAGPKADLPAGEQPSETGTNGLEGLIRFVYENFPIGAEETFGGPLEETLARLNGDYDNVAYSALLDYASFSVKDTPDNDDLRPAFMEHRFAALMEIGRKWYDFYLVRKRGPQ